MACCKLTREEKRSCGELYMKYRRFMYSVAVEHASCGMLAEDIVQNASYTLAMYSERIRNLDEPARLTYIRLLVQSSAAIIIGKSTAMRNCSFRWKLSAAAVPGRLKRTIWTTQTMSC